MLLLFFVAPISHAGEDALLMAEAHLCPEPSHELTPRQLAISLRAHEVVAARTGQKVTRQQCRNLDQLYKEAVIADEYLKQLTRNVAVGTEGTAVFPPGGGLKGRKRAREKIAVELGGDPSLLMDISRSSIEYDSVDQVYGALQYILEQGYQVVRLKDRALEPLPSGFWDIHLNLRMPNGHIAELQLHLKKIREYSKGSGHRLYKRIRDIKTRAFREGRPLAWEEQTTILRLNCIQRRFYEAAFKQGQRARKPEKEESDS